MFEFVNIPQAFAPSSLLQSFFIPKPSLDETNLPDQTGKVHIVTGGYSGVGEALTGILYDKNAVVYVAGRSQDKADESIAAIKNKYPNSKGRLEFMRVDLADLTTIKTAVSQFLAKEKRLDVLVNNAGVMFPPADEKSSQGYEMQMATNCLGPFLLSKLLTPLLKETAKTAPEGSVRVIWAASLGTSLFSPPKGVAIERGSAPRVCSTTQYNYGQSKTGNYFYAAEFHRRYSSDGVYSVAFNPGNLQSGLQRHLPGFVHSSLTYLGYPAVYGAYTELFSGWSPEITAENGGMFVVPWGRPGNSYLRSDILKEAEDTKTDENATPRVFWEWSDEVTAKYA
ncbi:short-chain alcohol dehydrogenase [Lecanicillium sp. MT-2017a]|nr:short-chain alcohol dehydrogenase [Lecanicillium sp. MT-2017a]